MKNTVEKANILENLAYSLIGVQSDLRSLPINHGDRSFLQEALKNIQAEIARVQAEQVKEVTQSSAAMVRADEIREQAAVHWNCKKSEIHFGECLRLAWWEVKVGGQMVFAARQDVAPDPEPEVTEDDVDTIEEDAELITRLNTYFDTTARFFKGQNRQRVYYGNVSQYTTVHAMMTKGVKGGFVKGIKQINKISDYMTRLNEMLRLAAVVEIATAPATLTTEPVNKFRDITKEMIDNMIERILSHQTTI